MILYIALVYYLVKFLFVYVRRFVNVMILIIVAPFVVTAHALKKIIWGTAGRLKLWFKELLYNVFIQSFHALAYSLMIGLALRVSDSLLSFVGAILVIIMFSFMLRLEKWIRMLFNGVGGVEMSKGLNTDGITNAVRHPIETAQSAKESIQNFDARQTMNNIKNGVGAKFDDVKESLNQVKDTAIDFKDNYKEYAKDAFDTASGKYVKVTQEEINAVAEKRKNSAMAQVTMAIAGTGKKIIKNAKDLSKELNKNISKNTDHLKDCLNQTKNDLNQDMQALNSMKKGLSCYKRRIEVMGRVMNETADDEDMNVAPLLNVGDSIEDEVEQLKEAMAECDGDIVSAMYQVYGPQAFMFNEEMGGSSPLALSTLASATHMDKIMGMLSGKAKSIKRTIKSPVKKKKERKADKEEKKKDEDKEKGNNENTEENEKENTSIATVDTKDDIQLPEEEVISKKKYKIVGCNDKALKTITTHLYQRLVLKNKLISPLYKANLKIRAGFVKLRGKAIKTEVSESTTESTENVTIRYQGNFSRHQLMQMMFARNQSIGTLKERQTDNGWARVSNIKQAQNRIYKQMMINNVVKASYFGMNMGRGDLSANRARTQNGTQEQSKTKERVRPKNREKTQEGMQAENMLRNRISKMFNNEIRGTKQKGAFSENPAENMSKSRASKMFGNENGNVEQKMAVSEEQADQMLSVLVVATAMQKNTPLETFDITENEENQNSILETLNNFGIVTNEEISNTGKKEEILKGVQEKINTLVTDDTDTYFQIVANYTNQKLEAAVEQAGVVDAEYEVIEEEPGKLRTMVNSAGEIVRQKVNEAGEIITTKVNEAGQVVETKVNQVGQFAGEKINQAGQFAGEKINQAGQFVGEKANQAGQFVNEKATQTKDMANALLDEARMNNQTINNVATKVTQSVASIRNEADRVKAIMNDPYVQAIAVATVQVAGQTMKEELKKAVDENISPVLNEASTIIQRDMQRAKIENPGELLKEKAEITKEHIKESIEEKKEEAADKVKEAVKSLIEPWPEEKTKEDAKGTKSEKGQKGKKGKDNDDDDDDKFIVYVRGEVVNPGKCTLPKISTSRKQTGEHFYTVWDAIVAAGGVTPDANMTVVSAMSANKLENSRTTVTVPRIEQSSDEVFNRCLSEIKRIIKNYRTENDLEESPMSELKEPMHKNRITSRLNRELRKENLTALQIDEIFEKTLLVMDKEVEIATKVSQQITEKAEQDAEMRKQEEEAAQSKAALSGLFESMNARLEAVPSQNEGKQKAREMEIENYENGNYVF